MKLTKHMPRWMERAIWEGDQETLQERAPCRCCCYEHTSEQCPARLWAGCLGQGNDSEDFDAWVEHYKRFHGMSREKFEGRGSS